SSMNNHSKKDIDVAVIHLPHISNFTDIDALKIEDDASVRFVSKLEEFNNPDLVILPGSKNTIDDLIFLRNSGLEEKLLEYSKSGRILGICGGYQMLGKEIIDPHKVESDNEEVKGIGIIPCSTKLNLEKTMTRAEGITALGDKVYGYEIHMGETKAKGDYETLVRLTKVNGEETEILDGYLSSDKRIMATYLHGILDSNSFRGTILNDIRREKGLSEKEALKYEAIREKEINKLAKIVRESLDISSIYETMGIKR
ncbi:MAG: cobyric acid synthase CobQ, partial [Peptostreptococcaceae bacterium]